MKLILLITVLLSVFSEEHTCGANTCGASTCGGNERDEDFENDENLLNVSEFYEIVYERNDEFAQIYDHFECDEACERLGFGIGEKWNFACLRECREYKDQLCEFNEESGEDSGFCGVGGVGGEGEGSCGGFDEGSCGGSDEGTCGGLKRDEL